MVLNDCLVHNGRVSGYANGNVDLLQKNFKQMTAIENKVHRIKYNE